MGKNPTLSKKQSVLDRTLTLDGEILAGTGHPGTVIFRSTIEDQPELTATSASFLLSDWEAMGSPEQITVTIEPGDRLN